MALQPISSSTSTADGFLTTLSQEERDKLVSGLCEFGVIPQQAGSSQCSTSWRPSSSKSTRKPRQVAKNVEVITLISSDSEDDDDDTPSHDPLDIEEADSISIENRSESSSNENISVLQSSESDDEQEYQFDFNQEAITLDDEEPAPLKSKAKGKMVCYRCQTEKDGTFTNEDKFRIHIQRHLYGDIFQCATCHRPFSKITFCISHEIRVHGTQLSYESRDGVISYAKRYVEERAAKRAQRAAAREPTPSTSSANQNPDDETGEETDDEDPKFYNNQIVTSTALYPYRGPPVEHLVKAYEIYTTHARRKNKQFNEFAKKALEKHAENVEKERDTYKLKQCPFAKKKNAAVGNKGKATKGRRTRKPARKSQPVAAKIPVSVEPEAEEKRVSNPKKRRSEPEGCEDPTVCSSEEVCLGGKGKDLPTRKLRSTLKLK